MIQIEALHVEEFRGIRNLDLDLSCKSFVVLGPNGSGKSGVVDAIDFALTGNVTRLSGAGTGGVTLAKHGPHVHRRDDPAAARVALRIRHVETSQTAVLTRCVKTPGQYTLDPSTPEMVAAVDWASQHPELTLSRREVIKYVNAESGKRAQEVQALLKLDRIDEIRRLLRSALTKSSNGARQTSAQVDDAEDSLRRHLDLGVLLEPEVLTAVNKHRVTLSLDPLTFMNSDTDLSVGASGTPQRAELNKASAIRDLQTLVLYVAEHAELTTAAGALTGALVELEADPSILDALMHRQLVEIGLPLVSEASCPLCDQRWPDADGLRAHLQGKLTRSQAAADLQQRIRQAAGTVAGEMQRARGLLGTAQRHALVVGRTAEHAAFLEWSNELAVVEGGLGTFEGIQQQAARLASGPLAAPAGAVQCLAGLQAAIEAVPDQSAAENARTALTVAQERWKQLRQARVAARKAEAAHRTAQAIYETYNAVADTALTSLYKTVEEDFSDYYRRINSDDESSFRAGLGPSSGKLDLEVDFYGLGMFPPMAYHSEGHQDGMGVCLYLALLGQLLQDEFRLAVLDDVVTSVDTNHRRQFCKLLADVFPNVQFVITTHDEVWARQMQSSGLIGRRSLARFHGWSVDGGPLYGQGGDFWAKIEADLGNDDVPAAAHKLRRNLEASMADIAGALQAKVPYRPDNNYDLGTFFAAVKGRHGDLLKKAADSANAWNNQTAKAEVDALKAQRAKAILGQDDENWAINALVHNNDWAAMTKADFTPVVEACKQFSDLFTCSNADCDSWIYVSGLPGSEEALRCVCGTLNLNLRRK